MNLRRFCALNDTEILELAARCHATPSEGFKYGCQVDGCRLYPLRDFRHSRRSGNVLRNSATCLAQMGTQRRRFIECTLAAAFLPHRRSREPALPIAFPHFRSDLLDDLLRGTWKYLLTLNLEDHSCFIYVCGLSAAPVSAQYICSTDQQGVQQDEGRVGSGKADPQWKEVVSECAVRTKPPGGGRFA
jgi:hypothetical protein